VLEILHTTYIRTFSAFPQVTQPHPLLQVKLFKDRDEFRRCNRGVGWAEAFYRTPVCHAYYSAREMNPYQWMLHEAVHQLNTEVAQLKLPQWADEGLAEYFSTSQIRNGELRLGEIDRNTYPIWWLDDMALSGDLAKDIAAHKIIPLRTIVTGRGGPNMNEEFNLYYIHWWSLVHFLFQFDGGKYRESFFCLLRDGVTETSFERQIGSLDRIQREWCEHLQTVRKRLNALPPRPAKPRKLTWNETRELEGMEAQILAAEGEVARIEGLFASPEFHRTHAAQTNQLITELAEAKQKLAQL